MGGTHALYVGAKLYLRQPIYRLLINTLFFSAKYRDRSFVWSAGLWRPVWASPLCTVFTQSPNKAANRLTRLRTLSTAPSVALFGVWRLLGCSMLATKDTEVRK